jgi:hypothetical protein
MRVNWMKRFFIYFKLSLIDRIKVENRRRIEIKRNLIKIIFISTLNIF